MGQIISTGITNDGAELHCTRRKSNFAFGAKIRRVADKRKCASTIQPLSVHRRINS